MEVVRERKKKCFERYFSSEVERRRVNEEYATFSTCLEDFSSSDSINDRWYMSPIKWWIIHGTFAPMLQSIVLKLLGQPCSSSCCERNWSTYNFIHFMKRNKLTPQRAKDLVYVHNNLRLLSRRLQTIMKVNLKCGTLELMVLTQWMLEFLRLQIFLLMNLN